MYVATQVIVSAQFYLLTTPEETAGVGGPKDLRTSFETTNTP